MKAKKTIRNASEIDRFNDALNKMSTITIQYRDSQLSHKDYAIKMDAIIGASGWSQEDFYKEIDRRKQQIGR